MNPFHRYLPWGVAVLAVVYFIVAAAPRIDPDGAMKLAEFGKVPVVDRGRVKPFDTLARNHLMMVSDKQTWIGPDGKEHSAVEWLLDVLMSPYGQEKRSSPSLKAFRVDNEKVRTLLDLPAAAGNLYSFQDMANAREKLANEAMRARKVDEKQRTPYETGLLELATQMAEYLRLAEYETPHKVFRIENDQVLNLLGLESRPQFRYSIAEFMPRTPLLFQEAARIEKANRPDQGAYEHKLVEVARRVKGYFEVAQTEKLLAIPPATAGSEDWLVLHEAIEPQDPRSAKHPAISSIQGVLLAYKKNDAAAFNRELARYQTWVDEQIPDSADKVGFETFFNKFAPFYQCSVMYVLAFLLACTAWLFRGEWFDTLRRTSFWLMAATLVVHSWALIARMSIQRLPPVTNLYSSAVFIGWGCVCLGLTLEVIYRNGIGNVVAAVTGFITLVIGHYLAASGDTLEMMQAVLDTPFWLATHVTAVTIGYTATFVAGCLGIIYVLLRPFNPDLEQGQGKTLAQMMYGIVCFAMFFSFVGTVLGGIWADQSWGRFWGWDPKENGALIIVIWNALVLHARWGGMIKQRGLALLTIGGSIVTSWSWFGVNMLGVGLHSYGFMKGAAFWLIAFVISQLVFIGIGLVPRRYFPRLSGARSVEPPSERKPRGRRDKPELVGGGRK